VNQKAVPIEAVVHRGESRVNIPTAELADFAVKEEKAPYILRYPRDPSLDPQLVWKGKDGQDGQDLEVPAVPVYIQEHISPQAIVEDLRREQAEGRPRQASLFADFNGMPLDQRVDFYHHSHNWTNRMVLGDSLLVMASLAEKEGLKSKVQMVYLDPPYGIKFGSNWQVSTRKRDVRDGRAEDATREPEQVKAFRDTWKLGIHSYLAYWRDRLVVARELLTETGSVFVQIGDENVHLVRCLMDEVFGSENFCSLVAFAKTSAFTSELLSNTYDFLLWYAKNQQNTKYRRLWHPKQERTEGGTYNWIELENGDCRRLTAIQLRGEDQLPKGKRFRADTIVSPGAAAGEAKSVKFRGNEYLPSPGSHWKATWEGMNRLVTADRVVNVGKVLAYKRFQDDFPFMPFASVWDDTIIGTFTEKVFVVQTATSVVERCVLMTTDPGDLVLDPTCVRKGTRVWVAAPLNPPVNGGTSGSSLPVDGGTSGSSLPVDGEGRGGALIPIEDIQPGHFVLGHDGKLHRVLHTIRKSHRGMMVGIQRAGSPQTLWVTADHRILCEKRTRSYGADRTWRHVPKGHFQRARDLRKEMTPGEQRLWRALRGEQLGVKFRKQHPIGPYIGDFYSWEAGLVIEVDGDSHFTSEAQDYDRERDAYLRSLGVEVLHFTNTEITSKIGGVLGRITATLQQVEPLEDHYRQWRRADSLQVGDVVYFGPEQRPSEISPLLYEQTEEEVYDLEVEGAHSFLTEVCAVHNCGSGTTAYVAEQWGRRWVTIDTSRVAVALARTRLMSARFPYYILADTPEGIKKQADLVGAGFKPAPTPPTTEGDIKKGFVYKRVPHVTLKSIANNPDIREGMTKAEIDAAIARHADSETLYDQPYEDNKVVRVTGPFTVESLSPHRVISTEVDRPGSEVAAANGAGPGQFDAMILDNLRKAGVQNTVKEERLKFESLEPFAGVYIHGDRTYEENGQSRRAAICIGPEHGTVGKELVQDAAKEAVRGVGFDLLVVCGFAFDPYVSEEAKRYGRLRVLPAKINPDLQMGDAFLKKTGAGNLFMVFGEPDIDIKKQPGGKLIMQINGVDVYDPTTGQVRSNSTDDIACWFIDTDYNEECFFVRHAYFCGGDEPYERLKRALKADVDESAWASLYSTTSRPFDPPTTGKIAIKVINHYGDEVLKVYGV
jgi:very-short-patch-repair endonuclease/DNA modification methylase